MDDFVGSWEGNEEVIDLKFGRVLKADRVDSKRKIAEFEFEELCDSYYGSSEYRGEALRDVFLFTLFFRFRLSFYFVI